MAFQDFWMNVRRAAGLITGQTHVEDSPRLDPNEIERTLRGRTTLWLTPRAVAGFDVRTSISYPKPSGSDWRSS